MRRVGLGASYIQMATFTLASTVKIKSMGKDHFIGSAYVGQPAPNNPNTKYSSIMGAGGEGCLTDLANISKQTVYL